MLKRLVIFLVLIAVLGGVVYALRPLSVEHTFSHDRRFGRLELTHKDWGGVSIAYGRGHAQIVLLEEPRVISPGDTGPSQRIVQKIYLRFFPPAIGSTPLWCVRNEELEIKPGTLLVTAETDGGQPFCDYIFEHQRLGDLCILEGTCEREVGRSFESSMLDFGGNTFGIQGLDVGVYSITFRSADGEVLCAYELTYQPELGNIATCFVPDSLKHR